MNTPIMNESARDFFHRYPAQVSQAILSAALNAHQVANLIHALGSSENVIAFASSYEGEGAVEIAIEAANTVAKSGKRALVIEVSSSPYYQVNFVVSPTASNEAKPAFINFSGTNLFYTSFVNSFEGNTLNRQSVNEALSLVRPVFDCVYICIEGLVSHSNSAAMLQGMDSVVLVVEAQRTRKPVAKQLKSIVQANNAKIKGLVFNRRRYYTPEWLYKFLYK